jgi:membrane fusion protein (multidrug efflux system)
MNGNDKPENSKPLFKKKKVFIPAILLIAAIAGFWYWYQIQLGHISTDDAYIDGDRVNISSKMLGRITDLYFDEGDTVKQGDLITVLDSSNIYAQKTEAEAQLNLTKENINLSKVKLEKAQEDFNRAELQFNNKLIPKQQYDHALKALQEMKAMLAISQSQVNTVTAKLNVLSTELENTKITCPMNGIVAKKWALKGDVVQPGQPIFSVYNNSDLWVTANYEETKISAIALGDSVDISVDAYPDQQFKGIVLQLGTNTASQFSLIPPNNASGNFTKVTQRVPVKISIQQMKDNSKMAKLLPGMSVEVDVREGK